MESSSDGYRPSNAAQESPRKFNVILHDRNASDTDPVPVPELAHVPPPTGAVLAGLIQYRLDHTPEDVFVVFPANDGPFTSVTFRDFGRACHRFSRAVCPEAPVTRGEIVGLVVNCDTLMYQTAICGLVRAGLTAFPISARLPPQAICHLLRTVSAHRLLSTTRAFGPLVDSIREEMRNSSYKLIIEELPDFHVIYPNLAGKPDDEVLKPMALPSAEVYPDGVEVWLHSSGSTGMPKAVPLTHKYISLLQFTGSMRGLARQKKPFITGSALLPTFHMMGLFLQIINPLMSGATASILRPNYPDPPLLPNPQLVLDAMKKTKCNIACAVPAYLEMWSHDQSTVDYLRTLTFVFYGGGPLSIDVGNKLVSQGVTIKLGYGLTEAGAMTNMFRIIESKENWAWIQLSDHVTARWVEQGEGFYELQVIASKTQSLAMSNLPDGESYATGDLFLKHPTVEGLWKIVGRADDVIVMSNGEKTVPAPLESAILAHPLVQGAIVFGRERDRVGIIIELKAEVAGAKSDSELAALRDVFWPVIEKANQDIPAFSRIFKEMILFTGPNKPLPRTAKGTIIRNTAWLAFASEIDELYNTVERPFDENVSSPNDWSATAVSDWLSTVAGSLQDGKQADLYQDLFANGFDSLTATLLRNHVISAIRRSAHPNATDAAKRIGNDFVYVHPTVAKLSAAIVGLLGGRDAATSSSSKIDVIRDMIDKYSVGLPSVATTETCALPERVTVLLTGSTGGLGSEILRILLQNERILKVLAFNRVSPAGRTSLDRQSDAFRDRGFDIGLLSSPKVVFLEGDGNDQFLGLSREVYEEIRATVNIVVHTAWKLDFNLSLASYEASLRTTRRLIDLAASSPNAPHIRFLFTSSIAVGQNWPREKGPFPEESIDDITLSLGSGYGEGKYVVEQILHRARKEGLHTTSFRIGQISGTNPAGTWAMTDWVPIIVGSSVILGCLPDAGGVVRWIQPGIVAHTIVDIALGNSMPSEALNIVHPRPVPWGEIMRNVGTALRQHGVVDRPLPLVPFDGWFGKLQERGQNAEEKDLVALPALKLLPFFGRFSRRSKLDSGEKDAQAEAFGMTLFATDKARATSRLLDGAEPLSGVDATNWVRYWKQKGLFSRASA